MINTAIDQLSLEFPNTDNILNSEPNEEKLIDLNSFQSLPSETIRSFLGKKSKMGYFFDSNIVNDSCFKQTSEIEQDVRDSEYPKTAYEHKAVRKDTFNSFQKWEGYVLESTSDHIIAKLVDLTDNTSSEVDIAEIPIQEISSSDLDLINNGAVFYWNIGYKDSTSGQRERISIIRFRRLPMWTKKEVDQASEAGKALLDKIRWD